MTQVFATIGNVELLPNTVHVAGQPLDLTSLEFKVLRPLLQHSTQVVTHQEILDLVYADKAPPKKPKNVLEVIVSRLRDKLKAREATVNIRTIRSCGYRLDRISEAQEAPAA